MKLQTTTHVCEFDVLNRTKQFSIINLCSYKTLPNTDKCSLTFEEKIKN